VNAFSTWLWLLFLAFWAKSKAYKIDHSFRLPFDIQFALFSFISSLTLNLDALYTESSAQQPILLMYKEESETVRRYFMNFAKHKVASKYTMIDMNALGSGEDKQIKRMMVKCMEEVRLCFHSSISPIIITQTILNLKGLLDFSSQLPQFATHSQPNRVGHSRKRQP
jgi:hypothetical protein